MENNQLPQEDSSYFNFGETPLKKLKIEEPFRFLDENNQGQFDLSINNYSYSPQLCSCNMRQLDIFEMPSYSYNSQITPPRNKLQTNFNFFETNYDDYPNNNHLDIIYPSQIVPFFVNESSLYDNQRIQDENLQKQNIFIQKRFDIFTHYERQNQYIEEDMKQFDLFSTQLPMIPQENINQQEQSSFQEIQTQQKQDNSVLCNFNFLPIKVNNEFEKKNEFLLQKTTEINDQNKKRISYKCNDFSLINYFTADLNQKCYFIGTILIPLSTSFSQFGETYENNIYKDDLVQGQKLELSFSNYIDIMGDGKFNTDISDQLFTFVKLKSKYVGYFDHNYSQIWAFFARHKLLFMTPYFAYKDDKIHIFCHIFINSRLFDDSLIQTKEQIAGITAKQQENITKAKKEAQEIFFKIMNIKTMSNSIIDIQTDEYKMFNNNFNIYPKIVIPCKLTYNYYKQEIKANPNRFLDIFSKLNTKQNNDCPSSIITIFDSNNQKYSNTLSSKNLNNITESKKRFDNFSDISAFDQQQIQPVNVKTQLHPYQIEGLSWLLFREKRQMNTLIKEKQDHDLNKSVIDPSYEELELPGGKKIYQNIITGEIRQTIIEEKHTYGGILADDMGMGKTLMCISLIHSTLQKESNQYGTLIIAPPNLLEQWENQFKTHSVENSISVLNISQKNNRKEDFSKYDVILCSYNLLSLIHQEDKVNPIFQHNWSRVILDEAQKIKNHKSKTAQACQNLQSTYKWCLTGTPIENNLEELFSLLCFLKVERFGELSFWRQFIKQVKDQDDQIKILQKISFPLILRRMKNSKDQNGNDILKLPNKSVMNIEIELSENEKELYNKIFNKSQLLFHLLKSKTDAKYSYFHIFQLLSILRQFCVHPSLAFPSLKDSNNNQMNIEEIKSENPAERIELFLQNYYERYQKQILQNYKQGNSIALEIEEEKENVQLENSENNQNKIKLTKNELEQIDLNFNYKEEVITQIKNGEYKTCQICLDDIQFYSISSCLHVLCSDCFKNSMKIKKQCPICRKNLEDNDVFDFVCQEIQLPSYIDEQSSKLQKVIELVENISQKNEKVVIFSQWIGTLDILSKQLTNKNISFKRYDGKLSKIQKQKALQSFGQYPQENCIQEQISDESINSDEEEIQQQNNQFISEINENNPTVLLASLKSGYVGLNLVGANHLILCDSWWNPSVEDQAIDRIYRIGQNKDTFIYRILCKDTIEERIQQIHEQKRNLISSILSNKTNDQIKIEKDDFNFLFS